jgi:hypothetical protein
MRGRQEVSERKKLVTKLEKNGVASSTAEAERLADQMLSTSDKVKKQHDAHRRAADDETRDETQQPSQTKHEPVDSNVSDDTKETIEKQRKQEQAVYDAGTPASAEEVNNGPLSTSTDEDDESDQTTAAEAANPSDNEDSEKRATDQPSSTSPSTNPSNKPSAETDDDQDNADLDEKREEADESNIDLGNVFDTSS